MPRQQNDPRAYPPFGLDRAEAARHVGVAPSTWDRWVREGIMPRPRAVGGVKRWVRDEVEAAFMALSADGQTDAEDNGWDRAFAS